MLISSLAVIALATVCLPSVSGEPDFDAIADKLVNQSLKVQPGEVVSINGGPTEIDLMEALVVAVSKAGGQPVTILGLPKANKRALMETPIEHLEQLPTAQLHLTRMADCLISIGSTQDPDLFADVPEERLAATRRGSAPLNNVFRNARFRSVSLGQTGGIPTKAYAESEGVDYERLDDMFWSAVAVAPDLLREIGQRVAKTLAPGAEVRVTTGEGTDLTFRIARHGSRVNAGRTTDAVPPTGPAQVWLPAGEAYSGVDETSASGTVFVPHLKFRGVPIDDLRLTFEGGRIASLKASKNGEILKKYLESTKPNSQNLSIVDIGLNPHSQPLPGAHYYSWEMGGMLTLSTGNNSWAGGDNDADGGLSLHVAGATITVDGKTVVDRGELAAGLHVEE
jgi:leucyl aminopeptidase (aminopeptidase T)